MAQDLAASGAALPELMQAGRWRSSAMPALYVRAQAAGRGAVAKYYADSGDSGQGTRKAARRLASLLRGEAGDDERSGGSA